MFDSCGLQVGLSSLIRVTEIIVSKVRCHMGTLGVNYKQVNFAITTISQKGYLESFMFRLQTCPS